MTLKIKAASRLSGIECSQILRFRRVSKHTLAFILKHHSRQEPVAAFSSGSRNRSLLTKILLCIHNVAVKTNQAPSSFGPKLAGRINRVESGGQLRHARFRRHV
ncbi:MAG: hypothetical protein O2944_09360, partial [Proteobacteria bacterium]|nr:hypothetical protein [Pseudomonadota bacterium]